MSPAQVYVIGLLAAVAITPLVLLARHLWRRWSERRTRQYKKGYGDGHADAMQTQEAMRAHALDQAMHALANALDPYQFNSIQQHLSNLSGDMSQVASTLANMDIRQQQEVDQ